LILISVFSVSISNLLKRVLMKDEKSDPFIFGFFFQFICSLLLFLFAFSRGFVFPPIWDLPFNFLLLAVLYAAFTIYLFKAFKTIQASEVVILLTTSSLWTIIIALLFLGETLSFTRVLGVLIIFTAVVLVNYNKKFNFQFSKGVVYALIAAFCIGVAFANDAYILNFGVDVTSFTAVSFFLPSMVILLVNPKLLLEVNKFANTRIVVKMFLLGFFYSIAAIAAYLAYQAGGGVSQLAPISQSRVVLTVILSALILKEKDNLSKKLFAAGLVTVGVLLLR
jgi:drug/metabolite transporter (DMT)-like permease